MPKRRPSDLVHLQVRLPEALRQKLNAEAEKAERSLNSEILWRLGQTFSEEWQRFISGVEEKERKEKERFDQFMNDPRQQKAMTRLIEEYFAEHPEEAPREKKQRGEIG
jgi:hypothetical protein